MFSIYSSIQDLELQSLEDGKLTTEVKISQKKVFVVDDNRFFLESLVFLLNRQKDIKVVGTYHRARGVLQKIKAAQPDVVILDVQLPDGDGISILQEIKSQLGIPVIMLTIYEEGRERAMKNGAYAYLVKGEELDILYQKIRQIGEI
ncbi:response regulator transcription factor [Candidatus Sordicultor fermentans]|uniref:response regulator n=1 Tax=Candidatus Sordicultor fermentans TaxID=1953203 RepID=UPI0016AD3DAB|nr:response regulator transcription factor [Atribacterota bacterium]NLY05731.1 response regulator [Candidatus Atribacteria bacterium]MDI9607137.1 response regulator transcription factor [Atribacterota bacterium]HOA98773.1 response regulator transcription factor [Candidatus Atribacteria bacterium]HOQ51673.1 response regulator transcription factor [Candidatus Atribacteria bacterium]